jgi:hypothetical protein
LIHIPAADDHQSASKRELHCQGHDPSVSGPIPACDLSSTETGCYFQERRIAPFDSQRQVLQIGSYYVVVANINGNVRSSTAAALTPVTAPGLAFQQDNTGLTSIETEHYFAASAAPDGHVWVPVSGRAENSGSGYMAVLPDAGVTAQIGANHQRCATGFQVNFTAAGDNYMVAQC